MGPHLRHFLRRQKQMKRESEHEKYRLHEDIPWVESPLLGAEGAESEELVFNQRHEANTLELFFDLFFVANLATFTAFHTITDVDALLAYIGFFAVLWCTWFQVTLHDVRFARDSKYERMCKFGQMLVFVCFALVGTKFTVPSFRKEDEDAPKDNKNFRILCYTLVFSRIQLAIQYGVVLCFTLLKGGYKRLILPLCMNTAVYVTSTIVFGSMSVAFLIGAQVSVGVVSMWWVVMFLEILATIWISSYWRILSFKATHLVERMGLLTLIVIGEGAIGLTKTVGKLMGKADEFDATGAGQVIAIMLLLIFVWALYFDNQPHGHYGTIRQQIWSVLHFPLHLAIVGVVEGAQQIAQTRSYIYNIYKFTSSITQYCLHDRLDGADLGAQLNATIASYEFDTKLTTKGFWKDGIVPQINLLASSLHQGVCNEANTTTLLVMEDDGVPTSFEPLSVSVWTALFASMGVNHDPKRLAAENPSAVAWGSFKTVYVYWWSSFAVLSLCLMAFLYMIRKHKADLSDYVGQATRAVMVLVSIVGIVTAFHRDILRGALASPYVIPSAVFVLAVINFSDKLIRQVANRRALRKHRPMSTCYKPDHHGKPHYDQLGHDPEKDPAIKGSQLKRQPPLEIVELDYMDALAKSGRSRAGTGYNSLASAAESKSVQPRELS